MKKAVVIGHLDWQGNHMIGAVVKARSVHGELVRQLGQEQVENVDIYQWKKRKPQVLAQLLLAFACCRNIVLVCSDTSVLLMKLFGMLKKVFRSNICYCPTGGDMGELLAQHPEQLRELGCIDAFLVETADCMAQMQALGLTNVTMMRNFKRIQALEAPAYVPAEPVKLCTFSRVVEQKGITDAIRAVQTINREAGRRVCQLDVYGPVDPGYEETFARLLKENDAACYGGVVDADSSVEVLKQYFCLLFPTRYQTEGVPGTIVDGFAAGVPVICADWSRCRQLVTDGVNGLIFPFGDADALTEKLRYAMAHPDEVARLRLGCLRAYEDYRPETAIRPLLEKLV